MIRIGIIGAGTMGQYYARAISECPATSLAAVADLELEKAQKLSKRYGAQSAYRNYSDMLHEVELDAVVVATPDFAHAEPAAAVLASGRHLLLEPPLATTLQDCNTILESAQRAGVRTLVNYANRHRPQVKRICSQLQTGVLGEITFVYSRLYEKLAKTWTLSWAHRTSPTFFLMSHIIDTVLWMTRKQVYEVFAKSVVGAVKKGALSEADSCVAVLSFKDGAVGAFDACWAMPETAMPETEFKIELRGTRGAIRGDLLPGDIQQFTATASTIDHSLDYTDCDGRTRGWWYDSVGYFINCILNDTPPSPSVEEAMEVSRIAIAIEYAAKRAFPVRIEDL